MENSEPVITIENKQRQAYFIAGLAETIRTQKIAQKDLAVKAQISPVTLSKVLNGKQGCSQEWRNKISKPLNMSEEELVKKGVVITTATHLTMPDELSLPEKPAPAALPENVIVTSEQGRALPIEQIIQVLRDKFQESEAEAREAKANMIRCYEVLEALHDSVTIVSIDRKILYQNHAAITFLGKHDGEDYDTVLAGIVPDSSPLEILLQKTFDLNAAHTKEVSINSGTYMVDLLPVAGDMGRVDRAVIIARPVSRNHQDQTVHARTQAAFNALDFSLIIFDQDRNLVRKNRTFCNMLNLNGQEIKTFDDLQTVASRMDNAGEVLTRMYKVFDQKVHIAGKCIHPDGKVLWQELTPLYGNEGEFLGVACQLRDWTGQEA